MSSSMSASMTGRADASTSMRANAALRLDALCAATTAAGAFVALATSTSTDAIRRAVELKDEDDPEVLHKLRVALRRLRSLWWAYEPLVGESESKLRREEFRRLADAAGATRDWDVLRAILVSHPLTPHMFDSLLDAVNAQRENALCTSRKTIANAGIEVILQCAITNARVQLNPYRAHPMLTDFAKERVEVAERTLKKRVKRAIQSKHQGYAALHKVRIAEKKVRYLLEFFSPVLDGDHHATIERLTAVQDELGKLNDLVVGEALLRQFLFGAGDAGVVERAIKLVSAMKQEGMQAARQMLCSAW